MSETTEALRQGTRDEVITAAIIAILILLGTIVIGITGLYW